MKFMTAATAKRLPQYSKIVQGWDDARERKEKTARVKDLSWKLLQRKDFSPEGIRDFFVAEKITDPDMQKAIGETAGTFYKQNQMAKQEKAQSEFADYVGGGNLNALKVAEAGARGVDVSSAAPILAGQDQRRNESILQGGMDFIQNGASSNLDGGRRPQPNTAEDKHRRSIEAVGRGWVGPGVEKMLKPEKVTGTLAHLGATDQMLDNSTGLPIGPAHKVTAKPGAGNGAPSISDQSKIIEGKKGQLRGWAINNGIPIEQGLDGRWVGVMTPEQASKLDSLARKQGFSLIARPADEVNKGWLRDKTTPVKLFVGFEPLQSIGTAGATDSVKTPINKFKLQGSTLDSILPSTINGGGGGDLPEIVPQVAKQAAVNPNLPKNMAEWNVISLKDDSTNPNIENHYVVLENGERIQLTPEELELYKKSLNPAGAGLLGQLKKNFTGTKKLPADFAKR